MTPYLDSELLEDKDTSMDGTQVTKKFGFEYKHPKMTKDLLKEVIDDYVAKNWFPANFLI